MNFEYKLPKNYTIKEMPSEEFDPLFRKHGKKIFNDDSMMYNRSDILTKSEIADFKKLRQNFNSSSHLVINLGLFFKNNFVTKCNKPCVQMSALFNMSKKYNNF